MDKGKPDKSDINELTRLRQQYAELEAAYEKIISRQKLADEALLKCENKFIILFEKSAFPASLSKFPEETIVEVNEAFEREFGFTKQEVHGKTYSELGINPDAESRKRILEAFKENGSVNNQEMVLSRKSGEKCYYETSIDKVIINGEEYLLNTIQNISKYKRTNNILKENYNLIRIAGEKAKLGGWIVILNENRSYWSDEVAAIHEMPAGYSPLVEDGINFYAPEWRDKITEVFSQCAQKGIPYDEEMEIITATGKRVWVRTIGEAVRDENENIVKVQGAFQDISTRKQTEEIAKQDKDLLNNFFKQSLTGFFIMMIEEPVTWNDTINKEKVLDYVFEHQHFVQVNQAMADQYLASEADFLSKTPNDLFAHDLNQGRNAWRELFDKGSLHIITQEKRFNGSYMWVEGDYICLYDSRGRISGHFGNQQDITERKQAEAELIKATKTVEKSEEKYRLLFANNPQPMWIYDCETLAFLEVNHAALIHYGYTKEEFLSMTLKDIRPDIDIQALLENIKNTNSTLNLAGEWRHIKKNGDIIDVEITSHSINFNDRNARHVLIKDVTERKRVQLEYQTMIKTSRDGFWIIDAQTSKFTEVNQSYCEMIGYTREELLHMTIQDIEAVETQEETRQHIKLIIEKGYDSFESKHKTKSGSIIDIDASVTFIGSDTNKFFVFVKEISERKRAENEILKLSHAVEQSPASIIVTNLEGTIEYVNQKTHEITGYTKDELIGKNPKILSSGEKSKDEYRILWNTISSGNEWFGEFHNKKKNGELYWESASISPIFNEKKEIINYVAIKEDITERKRFIDDLKIAKEKAEESDRLKSAFLANMSHEIRTPMNGILGFAGLLKEPQLSGEQQQKYIQIIEKSGARMLNIINDIVSISKIESGIMDIILTETNINNQLQFVYDSLKIEADNKKIILSLYCESPDEEAIIKTDGEKFYGILSNLVKNAIKYTITGTIELGYTKKGNEFEFYVKDTGIGIPKDRQSDIFERFIQADIFDKMARQGAGLGLAISRAYVGMLGGKIWVESEEGIGSIFYFTLPYITELTTKIIDRQITPSEKNENAQKLKILIAEDDETSEMLITINIEKYSKNILKASTGIEAVEVCRNNPDIDLILMDIQMPVMTGYEATQQIREFNKEVIIIAQTAYGLKGDREKAIESGCNDYIAKPINKEKLLALIQKHFGS